MHRSFTPFKINIFFFFYRKKRKKKGGKKTTLRCFFEASAPKLIYRYQLQCSIARLRIVDQRCNNEAFFSFFFELDSYMRIVN